MPGAARPLPPPYLWAKVGWGREGVRGGGEYEGWGYVLCLEGWGFENIMGLVGVVVQFDTCQGPGRLYQSVGPDGRLLAKPWPGSNPGSLIGGVNIRGRSSGAGKRFRSFLSGGTNFVRGWCARGWGWDDRPMGKASSKIVFSSARVTFKEVEFLGFSQ
eukprot:766197-Hanusia_phi.AAC.2